MIPLLTADEMRVAEYQAIQGWGIPSLTLQEHAALGALALLPPGEPIHVLAGPGNNGGGRPGPGAPRPAAGADGPGFRPEHLG